MPTFANIDVDDVKERKYLLYASLKDVREFFCTSVNFIRVMSSITLWPFQQGLDGVALYLLPNCI